MLNGLLSTPSPFAKGEGWGWGFFTKGEPSFVLSFL